MSLMAWFRKNNKKLMAFVVIALMIVFTIQPVMDYLSWRRTGGQSAFATYGNNRKIAYKDRVSAQKQLEIMRMLKADLFLRPQDPRMMPSQDLRDVLLGELLFAERANAAETITRIRQIVRRDNLPITDKQINAIYDKKYPSDIYWLLLSDEARRAGARIPLELARNQLEAIIPRLMEGMTYSRYVGLITKQQEVSEEQVLETFADLMGVLEYTKIMCSTEDRTQQQVLLDTNWRQESMDVEYVALNASAFAKDAQKPSEEKIKEQFEKYKDVFSADVNDANLYGFGYKLPDRVRLEYIAVEMNDVAATIPQPTQQETEEFYQQHLSGFAQQVPSDPNDPNSPLTTRMRSYAEVAGLISRSLYRQRVDLKTEQILSEAKSITEANLSGIEGEQSKLSDEQIRQQAGNYEKTAAQLSEKFKIKVHAGKTGLLSATDIQGDRILGVFYLEGTGFANVGLVRVAFAVEPLKASVLGPVDTKPPRLYENTGPLKDARESTQGYAGKNMMLVRVIEAQKAAAPESVDQKIDRRTISFDNKGQNDVNTVREYVIDDLKSLAAMKKAGDKAEELVKLAAKDGWDTAIEKLNKYYATINKETKSEANETPEFFTLQNRTGLRRVSPIDMFTQTTRYEGDPMAREFITRTNIERLLLGRFFALIPEDANTLQGSGVVVEFKPSLSYYCIKSMVIHRMSQEEFDALKGREMVKSAFDDGQSLAITFYNPENIIKRMNFKVVEQKGTPTSPAEGEPNSPLSPADGNEAARK